MVDQLAVLLNQQVILLYKKAGWSSVDETVIPSWLDPKSDAYKMMLARGMKPSGGGIDPLTGHPYKVITPTKTKPKATPTVNQQITVYASNTNDIAKKMALAAKSGVPIGGKP